MPEGASAGRGGTFKLWAKQVLRTRQKDATCRRRREESLIFLPKRIRDLRRLLQGLVFTLLFSETRLPVCRSCGLPPDRPNALRRICLAPRSAQAARKFWTQCPA